MYNVQYTNVHCTYVQCTNVVASPQSTQVESVHTELPFSYRKLPYCLPVKEVNYAENLGLF